MSTRDEIKCYLLENYAPHQMIPIYDEKLLQKLKEEKKKPLEVVKKPLPAQKIVVAPPPKVEKIEKAEKIEAVAEKPTPAFSLDKPLAKETTSSFSTFSTLYQKVAPGIIVHPTPPDDKEVKRRNMASKDQALLPLIPLFASLENRADLPFLNNLTHAIDTFFVSSRVYLIDEIEKNNRWNNLLTNTEVKLILLPETLLFKSPQLIVHYRETPQKLLKRLNNIPLLLLKDPTLYQKNPELKKELWETLTKLLKKAIS